MPLSITSPAFKHNQKIPSRFTCQGDDINPTLHILEVPKNAKSLVLINDDPDAPVGTWDHWIVFNIAPSTTIIAEDSVPQGAIQAKNSWKRSDYGGPCPPSGTHRYFFKLYALDTTLSLASSATKHDVEKAMQGHIIQKAELVGLYSKE
ncbi:MAG TPA: YbhB/YbcL family Raf kinase inhibitor-like protein [Candidatus Nanoarchaeia archaeon]|nr:YbhB/YbcL family Raf kinase inhibitor-like protein [Candidatus Nanoarchaeia archaeon]